MKKRNLFILTLLSAALVLGACGNSAVPATGTETDEAAVSQEQVTISYGLWGDDERKEYTLEQIAAFEEKYPYISVDLQCVDWDTLKDEINGIMEEGAEPDVMQINYSWLAEYSPDGNGYYDLNQLSDVIQFDAFAEHSLPQGQRNGKQNAITIAMNTSVPVYNKTLFDQYDVDIPESVDELYDAAKVMQEHGIYLLGMEDKQVLLFLCGCYQNAYGASVVDGDGDLNLTELGSAYLALTYKSCIEKGVFCPSSEYSEGMLKNEQTAGIVCWLNSIDKYEKVISAAGDEAEVGKFFWTDTEETLGNFVKPSSMLAISANTDHPREAGLFLNYLLNDETAVQLQGVEKGVPDSRFAQQALMEAGELKNDTFYTTLSLDYYLEYMDMVPQKLEDQDVIDAVFAALDAYVDGSSTLDETVAALRKIN